MLLGAALAYAAPAWPVLLQATVSTRHRLLRRLHHPQTNEYNIRRKYPQIKSRSLFHLRSRKLHDNPLQVDESQRPSRPDLHYEQWMQVATCGGG